MATRVLPTGTITFLFSDIEGSTKLVADVGPAMFRDLLEAHNRLLRAAFATHAGVERGTQGDSFLVMFQSAVDALVAAIDAQRAITAHDWPDGALVRVRMGLHTGLGILGGDDYVGLDVNRAARIASAAHGGQVLLSDATRGLVAGTLPPGVAIQDLGGHGLRDLPGTEHLFQLVVPGLRSDFPPLRTNSSVRPDLPPRTTELMGRDRELAELGAMLVDLRLITLTGPGGTGKSSLAAELARRHLTDHDCEAHWMPLASVSDARLVAGTIADRLGVLPGSGRSALDGICDVLRDRPTLLVLDNMERLLPAAPMLSEMLDRASALRMIVTSRAPLHLALEQEYPVAPLPVPVMGASVGSLRDNPSVRVFLTRAARVQPGYTADGADLEGVAAICRRLDGLPLGIELAASRVRLLTPGAIADRLAQRLDLPGSTSRDVPERQRTLTATMAWSYDLLDAEQQRLFARLSVFAGGGSLEEVELVCAADGPADLDVLEPISGLVDQSLVVAQPGPDGLRVRQLETIRRFAGEQLSADPIDADATRHRHALAYLALAERAATRLPGREQVVWLDRLTLEHDNLRAAVAWAVDTGAAEIASRLGAASWRFWQLRGHLDEGRAAMTRILAMPDGDVVGPVRARALGAAGSLAWWAADIGGADDRYREALAVAHASGDRRAIADAAFDYAHTRHVLGDPDRVATLQVEARRTYSDLGAAREIARIDWTGGWLLLSAGRVEDARDLMLGLLSTFETLDDEFYVAMTTMSLGGIALQMGALDDAAALGLRSLLAQHAMGDAASFTLGLRAAALVFQAMGHHPEAALINSAFEGLCQRYGIRPPADPSGWIPVLAADPGVVRRLTSDTWADEIARGAGMSVDQAMEEVLRMTRTWGIVPDPSLPSTGRSTSWPMQP